MYFAFRVSVSYQDASMILLELFDMCEKVAVYEHEADEWVKRTHIHGIIMNCSRKEDTLRNKIFKPNWKKDYQLAKTYKKCDENGVVQVYPVDDGYITYMSKGHLDPMYVKGYIPERIKELKEAWVDYEKPENKTEQSKDKKTMTVYDHCEAIAKDMEELVGDYHLNVIAKIIKYQNSKRIKTNTYQVRDWYDTIVSQLKPNDYKNMVWNLIKKRDGHFA